MRTRFPVILLLLASPLSGSDKVEFFEKRIRPILAQECYECHSEATKSKGGLLLDSRAGWQKGGDSGPVILPGDVAASLLLKSIRHEDPDLQMPDKAPQLEPEILRDFEQWVRDGAVDPRDAPPSKEQLAADNDWPAIRDRRAQWWSFQPLPETPAQQASLTALVDREIQTAIEANGLATPPKAEARVLLRRLTFTLTGLPPTFEQTEAFLRRWKESPQKALEHRVDELLESPAFGERWARHWMDWMRYAETHGSEGDPAIPHAWRYRDYLIRALNEDVSYPDLIREHLAGDLLDAPRINEELHLNESALGTAHYRMVLHGFTPTDPLDELVTFTDNQIDVLTKAFLGVTVSCARCHHHKFDPISQDDFYALYGIFASTKPALIDVDASPRQDLLRAKMGETRQQLRTILAGIWTRQVPDLGSALVDSAPAPDNTPASPLSLWDQASQVKDAGALKKLWIESRRAHLDRRSKADEAAHHWKWHASEAGFWHADGRGSISSLSPTGSFHVPHEGDQALTQLLPAGYYSHLDSSRDRGVLISNRFPAIKGGQLWVRVAGEGGARARFAAENYPRRGTVYPKTELRDKTHLHWVKWDVDYFDGDTLHLELATEADQPVETKDEERSWFGITDAVYLKDKESIPDRPTTFSFFDLIDSAAPVPASRADLARLYETAALQAIEAWRKGSLQEAQTALLNALIDRGVLTTRIDASPELAERVEQFRALETALASPQRAPGVLEADPFDQPLFVRGDHRNPVEPVQRRFLEAIDATPYEATDSGRMQLADSLLAADNPLTWRVIVNRVWHHLFGAGLVTTMDNFGRLGEKPSHPELLDQLALRFRDGSGSLKQLIRDLVLTQTFQRSSNLDLHPSRDRLAEVDPTNRFLSHFPVRRLEAESIRDAILATSGALEPTLFGAPVSGSSPRRSVYVRVIRNNLDPLLSVFDAPVPSSTRGKRDATNVPAQSLALLNDPDVIRWSGQWAQTLLRQTPDASTPERLEHLYQTALTRPPNRQEQAAATAFLHAAEQRHQDTQQQWDQLAGEQKELQRESKLLLARARTEDPDANGPDIAAAPDDAILAWNFRAGLEDQVTGLPLTLQGGARIKDGILVLDGKPGTMAASEPLADRLKEKSLEAWVRVEDLDQRGGGILTLQNLSGQVFDSIVFAERKPRQWHAGSDNSTRSEALNGTSETGGDWVHLVLTYGGDGTITAYRNGKVYGKAYRKAPLAHFQPNQSQVLLGCRHGQPAGNRVFKGEIARVALYDRALRSKEVQDLHRRSAIGPTETELIASLPKPQQEQYQSLQQRLKVLDAERRELERTRPALSPSTQAWADLAQAMLNLKEFIYLR